VALSDAQIELYSRQIIQREIGGTGQKKLLAARCLVDGGGAAIDTALSYLAGAGVGAIDVVPFVGAVGAALPLAALGTRAPDTALRTLARGAVATLDGYDVVLRVRGAGEPLGAEDLPPGRARAGSIAILTARDGALGVLIVPEASGCLACVTDPRASDVGAGARAAADVARPASAIALGAAGALAALACCLWLTAAGRDPAPRLLRLAPSSALWRDDAPVRAPCPRGCPPVAEPL
jgi:hypothetical protein